MTLFDGEYYNVMEHPTEPQPEESQPEPDGMAKLIMDLVVALQNIENDDKHIPQPIWDMRNAALEQAKQKGWQ